MLKKTGLIQKIIAVTLLILMTGCASMLGLDRPSPEKYLIKHDDNSITSKVGVVTRIKLREYKDTSVASNTSKGLATEAASNALGGIGSTVMLATSLLSEDDTPDSEKTYFQILTIEFDGEETQVIQPDPVSFPTVNAAQDFKVGEEVTLYGHIDKEIPVHAIRPLIKGQQ